MGFTLDPEIAAAMAPLALARGNVKPPERGDWKTRRDAGNLIWDGWARQGPQYPDVLAETSSIPVSDGATIRLRWYSKRGSTPGSAVVYAHGGGMIMCNLDHYDFVIGEYVEATGVPFLSVEYRLAPEVQGTTLSEDVFAALTWLSGRAAQLGVDPKRIAVMGDSGGGAVAAGAAILARERHLPLARQILIYPMLDDRNQTPDPYLAPFAVWDHDSNFTAWSAVLGTDLGGDTVSPVAAPARLADFAGLAPAYIEVGELDIFRDEDIVYGRQLARAGVPVELHVHPGAPHGYDRFAADSDIVQRAMRDRLRVLRSL
ncbi:MAG: alpha/beta hydrolase protein [Bradyrhizobium sp.]|nr:alpha/beta hydrolase protein [Bradyrhizobium sp.]